MNIVSKPVIAAETFKELRGLFDDSAEAQNFVNELIKIYLESGKESVQSLSQTLDRRDFSAFKKHAHKLKGLSRNIGANRVGDLCADLEVDVPDQSGVAAQRLYGQLVSEFQQACDELNRTYFRAS